MRSSIRLVVASFLIGATLAACAGTSGPGTTTPSPTGTTLGEASPIAPSAATPGASDAALRTPSASAPASPPALPGFACPAPITTVASPSNRLTDVVVTAKDGYDEVAFVFGPSGSGSGIPPEATVRAVAPPFVAGASGLPLAVAGESFVALTLRDMVVADENGSPTYAGPTSLRPSASGVAEVVQAEAFEGLVTWIVGSHAPGCVRVRTDSAGSRILVDIQRA